MGFLNSLSHYKQASNQNVDVLKDKIYKAILDSVNEPNHSKLLEYFNLNPENKNSRLFAGLIEDGAKGIQKNVNQLKVLGHALNTLNEVGQLDSFINEVFEKDNVDKIDLPKDILNNSNLYIDLKSLIINSIKYPEISEVNINSEIIHILKKNMNKDFSIDQKIGKENVSIQVDDIENIIHQLSLIDSKNIKEEDYNIINKSNNLINNLGNNHQIDELKKSIDIINKELEDRLKAKGKIISNDENILDFEYER